MPIGQLVKVMSSIFLREKKRKKTGHTPRVYLSSVRNKYQPKPALLNENPSIEPIAQQMITRIGNDAIRRVLLSSSRVVRPTVSFQQTDTFAKPMCMISPMISIFPLKQHQQPRSFAFTTASSPLYKQEELDEYLNSLSPARKKFMTILNEYKVSKNMH